MSPDYTWISPCLGAALDLTSLLDLKAGLQNFVNQASRTDVLAARDARRSTTWGATTYAARAPRFPPGSRGS